MSTFQYDLTATQEGGVVWDALARWTDSPAVLADLSAMLYDPPRDGWTQAGRPRGERAKCGTVKAYKQHLYYGESTDVACRRANADRVAQQKRAKLGDRLPKPFKCGTMRGYKHHLEIGEVTCDRCRAANVRYKNRRAAGQPGQYTVTSDEAG